ncbi:MAG: hypothetical protein IJP92_17020 [Lachnospiraceae bacterium]|nr:hypothetical protein [Lachnospiraceae bacterium]
MLKNIEGKVAWVFDEPNFDVDLVIGLENISVRDPEQLKMLCMKNYTENFAQEVEPGDVFVGGENLGYGHPHKGGPESLRYLGLGAIIADSFSPGFYRANSITGFPLIACPGISKAVKKGDRIIYDWDKQTITNETTNTVLECTPMSQKDRDIVDCGGLVPYIKKVRMGEA